MDQIIVPLDGSPTSERAIVPAAALANQAGARLLLVTVTDDATGRRAYLEDAAARAAVQAEARVLVGHDPADAISAFEHAHRDTSVVCMASHARGALAGAVLGSVAADVVRSRPGPVVLVGPHCDDAIDGFKTVVVPLDGSAVADAAMPLATAWAARLSVPVLLVSVVDPDAEWFDLGPPYGTDVVEGGNLQRNAHELHDEGIAASWEVLHGRHPADVLADYLTRTEAPLVVMSTHGRSGLSALTMGSVAVHLVHRTRCPVVLVRPLAADRS